MELCAAERLALLRARAAGTDTNPRLAILLHFLRGRWHPPYPDAFSLMVHLCHYVWRLDQMRAHVRHSIRAYNHQRGVPRCVEDIRTNLRHVVEDYGAMREIYMVPCGL
jgi:hypothetical protein